MRRCVLALLTAMAAGPAARADGPPLTVGPGGAYATIDLALAAIGGAAGPHDVRVAKGSYASPGRIVAGPGVEITLTGGWRPGFGDRDEVNRLDPLNPSLNTLLVASGDTGRVDAFTRGDGRLTIRGFVLTSLGAVVLAQAFHLQAEDGSLTFSDNAIWDYHARPEPDPEYDFDALNLSWPITGLGDAAAGGESLLRMERNVIAHSTFQSRRMGQGLVLLGFGGELLFRDNEILENEFTDGEGGGSDILSAENNYPWAMLQFEGNHVRRNHSPAISGAKAQMSFRAREHGRVMVERNEFLDNSVDAGDAVAQLELRSWHSIVFRDNVVAGGNAGGLLARSEGEGHVSIANATIADHPSFGIRAEGSGLTLSNTILSGNAFDELGGVIQSHNLVETTDPLFLDPAARDYRPSLASPAIDAGSDRPTGETGPLDVASLPRISGRQVDIGAHEAQFEGAIGCLAGRVDGRATGCLCAADPGLTEVRCGFLFRDLIIAQRNRIFWSPEAPLTALFTLDPWKTVDGPYWMASELRSGGNWIAQEWQGPTAAVLKDGQTIKETFKLGPLPSGRTVLRTTLKYTRAGETDMTRAVMEVLLPDPKGPGAPK